MHVDVQFPVRGEKLPTDHAYLLYAALSQAVPAFHHRDLRLRFAPINGERGGKGEIRLFERSRLRMRMPAEQISSVLLLVGQMLRIGDHPIRLQVPTVQPLVPAPTLAAKVVTYKNATDPARFLDVTRRSLDELGITGEPGIPLVEKGGAAGQPRRRIIRIKGRRVVGYTLQVAGLAAEESINLQERGLGGRQRMGCGFFVPDRPRAE